MDGLALLCNLHADGPLTLRRLREAGIRSLFDLERVQSTSLALVLHASATQARRFAEEGKILASRLEEEPLESEAAPGEATASPYEGRLALSGRVTATVQRSWSTPVAELAPPGRPRSTSLERILAPVPAVEARVEPPVLPAPATLAQPSALPAIAPLGLTPTRPADPPARDPVPEPAQLVDVEGTPLHAARLSGLDEKTSQRLLEHGVRTLKALVELTSLALARRTGIPYTKLLDLSFQARRFLGERLLPSESARTSAAGGDAFELRPGPSRGGHSREGLAAERPRDPQPTSTSPSRAGESQGRPWTDVTPVNVPAGTPEDPGPAGPFV